MACFLWHWLGGLSVYSLVRFAWLLDRSLLFLHCLGGFGSLYASFPDLEDDIMQYLWLSFMCLVSVSHTGSAVVLPFLCPCFSLFQSCWPSIFSQMFSCFP